MARRLRTGRVTALGVTAALVLPLAVVGTAHADWPPGVDYCTDVDYKGVQLLGSSLSPSSTTIGKKNRTFTIEVKASDDCGVAGMFGMLRPKANPDDDVIVLYESDFRRVAGDDTSGTWRATKPIEDQQVGGVWGIEYLWLRDTHYNDTVVKWPRGSMHLRHITKTTLRDPADKVKSKVTVVGRLRSYGDFGTWKVQLQSRKPGKAWQKAKNVTTNVWGDFIGTIPVKGTTYVRAVHFQNSTTTYSESPSYRVKKK